MLYLFLFAHNHVLLFSQKAKYSITKKNLFFDNISTTYIVERLIHIIIKLVQIQY